MIYNLLDLSIITILFQGREVLEHKIPSFCFHVIRSTMGSRRSLGPWTGSHHSPTRRRNKYHQDFLPLLVGSYLPLESRLRSFLTTPRPTPFAYHRYYGLIRFPFSLQFPPERSRT